MNKSSQREKIILIIRDGWGYRKEKNFNFIAEAKTPNDDQLRKKYPWTILKAAGEAVGLPNGYQGNSEVGHLTIGSGRIIDQSLYRINKSIKDGSFFEKKEFIKAINHCKKNNSFLHIMGLLQKEGVHSHMDHLLAILEICEKNNFKNVFIHIITDGRDAPVNQAKNYLAELIKKNKIGEIVTISGRYYAMDRDKRWARTKKAYQTIVEGKSSKIFKNPLIEIKSCYQKGETDEFIIPRKKENYSGFKENDAVIFFNLRTDRPRQLTQAIIEDNFQGWKRKKINVFFVTMTDYYKPMSAEVVFKEIEIKNILGEILSKNNIKQLRISETEKYPHVTFFFNGQEEKPFKKEDRIMIFSPKVSTYDKKPEMSVKKVTNKVIEEINKEKYEFIVINLVNADMVGHTGIKKAIIKAVEAVDQSVGKIVKAGLNNNYTLFVFADHGNAEDKTKKWGTSHTINPVPFILVSKNNYKLKDNKGLKDIAPTVLKIMKIEKPKEMTGESVV